MVLRRPVIPEGLDTNFPLQVYFLKAGLQTQTRFERHMPRSLSLPTLPLPHRTGA